MNPNREKTISIVQSHGCSTSNLIAILQDIQAACSYLSEESLTVVAEMLDVSVSSVYSVATFYENFSLEPKGRHIIKVCAGTACHVRKSGPIYDAIHEYLGLNDKRKTSSDGMFTLETVLNSVILRKASSSGNSRPASISSIPRSNMRRR